MVFNSIGQSWHGLRRRCKKSKKDSRNQQRYPFSHLVINMLAGGLNGFATQTKLWKLDTTAHCGPFSRDRDLFVSCSVDSLARCCARRAACFGRWFLDDVFV